jgi:hypothetical protein
MRLPSYRWTHKGLTLPVKRAVSLILAALFLKLTTPHNLPQPLSRPLCTRKIPDRLHLTALFRAKTRAKHAISGLNTYLPDFGLDISAPSDTITSAHGGTAQKQETSHYKARPLKSWVGVS